jgi:asparagine synthase (glutamine-hydrolysing)
MDRATDFDAQAYLPGDILAKVDRATMAHGLESRAPFLDVDLVEFVWSLPWRLRFADGSLKGLLREACGDLWPQELRQRPKQGFGAPIWAWVERPDVRNLLQRISRPRSPLVALLPGVGAALPRLKPQVIWTVLCLGLWLEKHPDSLRRLAA